MKQKKKVKTVYLEDKGQTIYSMAALDGKTPEEKEEQAQLRAEYIADFRRSTIEILDNTYLQRPDGTKEKLKPKS